MREVIGMMKWATFLGFAGFMGIAAAQSVVAPKVPADLKVPTGEKVFIHAHAKGVQILCVCGGSGREICLGLESAKGEIV